MRLIDPVQDVDFYIDWPRWNAFVRRMAWAVLLGTCGGFCLAGATVAYSAYPECAAGLLFSAAMMVVRA